MALQVTKSKKDSDGDIIGLCGYGWSHPKAQAVSNIRAGVQRYYVTVSGRDVNVRIGTRNGKGYLTTSPDGYAPNNLDTLPDC